MNKFLFYIFICLAVIPLSSCKSEATVQPDYNSLNSIETSALSEPTPSSSRSDGIVVYNNIRYHKGTETFTVLGFEQPSPPEVTSIEILSNINGKPVRRMGMGAFSNSEYLESVILPDTLTEIGDSAFSVCINLRNITFPSNLKRIGDNVFMGCPIEELKFPETLECIGKFSFTLRTLKKVYFPKTLSYIGVESFSGTPWKESLTDEFVIVGDGLLLDYNGPGGEVAIPNTVKGIVGGAFECHENPVTITKLEIPESTHWIGKGALTHIKPTNGELHVKIPPSVGNMDNEAFFSDLPTLKEQKLLIIYIAAGSYAEQYNNTVSHNYSTRPIEEWPGIQN